MPAPMWRWLCPWVGVGRRRRRANDTAGPALTLPGGRPLLAVPSTAVDLMVSGGRAPKLPAHRSQFTTRVAGYARRSDRHAALADALSETGTSGQRARRCGARLVETSPRPSVASLPAHPHNVCADHAWPPAARSSMARRNSA
jgi:hypothetical protein